MKKVKIKYSIKLVKNLAATRLSVHTATVDAATLEASRTVADPNVLEGEFEVKILSNSVSISLSIVGEAYKSGSFNLTVKGKKVFAEDQTFTTKGTGRVNFFKTGISLP